MTAVNNLLELTFFSFSGCTKKLIRFFFLAILQRFLPQRQSAWHSDDKACAPRVTLHPARLLSLDGRKKSCRGKIGSQDTPEKSNFDETDWQNNGQVADDWLLNFKLSVRFFTSMMLQFLSLECNVFFYSFKFFRPFQIAVFNILIRDPQSESAKKNIPDGNDDIEIKKKSFSSNDANFNVIYLIALEPAWWCGRHGFGKSCKKKAAAIKFVRWAWLRLKKSRKSPHVYFYLWLYNYIMHNIECMYVIHNVACFKRRGCRREL